MISGLNSTGHEIGGTSGSRSSRRSPLAAAPSPAHRPPPGSRTRSSQPVSSLVSPAWSLSPSSRRHATSCRSYGSTPARCRSTDDGEIDDTRRSVLRRGAGGPTPNAASPRSSTPLSRRWRAIPTAACRRSLAAPRRSRHDLRHFPTRTLSPRRRHGARNRTGRRGDERRPAPARRARRGAGAVLRATWRNSRSSTALLALNTARLSAEELHRRHVPMLDQLEPLIERGQNARNLSERSPCRLASRVIRRSCTPLAVRARAADSWSPKRGAMLSTAIAAISVPPQA